MENQDFTFAYYKSVLLTFILLYRLLMFSVCKNKYRNKLFFREEPMILLIMTVLAKLKMMYHEKCKTCIKITFRFADL